MTPTKPTTAPVELTDYDEPPTHMSFRGDDTEERSPIGRWVAYGVMAWALIYFGWHLWHAAPSFWRAAP